MYTKMNLLLVAQRIRKAMKEYLVEKVDDDYCERIFPMIKNEASTRRENTKEYVQECRDNFLS